MIKCALCEFEHEHSIVPHIVSCHDLKTYLNCFPDIPVVSRELFTAVENAQFFGYVDDTPGLSEIGIEERESILVSARNSQPLRSSITVSPDF